MKIEKKSLQERTSFGSGTGKTEKQRWGYILEETPTRKDRGKEEQCRWGVCTRESPDENKKGGNGKLSSRTAGDLKSGAQDPTRPPTDRKKHGGLTQKNGLIDRHGALRK